MTFNRSAVGKAIKAVRTEKGLSQEVLSGLADIGRAHLSMIETGRKTASLETIWKLAGAFNMNPSELIQRIERNEGAEE